MTDALGITQPGVPGGATVLGETGATQAVARMGEFAYKKAEQEKVKSERLYEDLLNVATDVWIADQSEFDGMLANYKQLATDTWKKANDESREPSMKERMELTMAKNKLVAYRKQSLEQKATYDKLAGIAFANPDKFDMDGTLGNLNTMYKEKKLSERDYGDFFISSNKSPKAYNDWLGTLGYKPDFRYNRTVQNKERARRIAETHYDTEIGRKQYNNMVDLGILQNKDQFIAKVTQDLMDKHNSSVQYGRKSDSDANDSNKEYWSFRKAGYHFVEDVTVTPVVRRQNFNGVNADYVPITELNIDGLIDEKTGFKIGTRRVIPTTLAYYRKDKDGYWPNASEIDYTKDNTGFYTEKPFIWGLEEVYDESTGKTKVVGNWIPLNKAQEKTLKRQAKILDSTIQKTMTKQEAKGAQAVTGDSNSSSTIDPKLQGMLND